MTLDSNGLLIHDQPAESNSKWAMRLNSTGFMIANSKLPDGSWNWRTFGTGAGFTADSLVAGIIKGLEIQGVNILGSTVTGGTVNGANINGGHVRMGPANRYITVDSSGVLQTHMVQGDTDIVTLKIHPNEYDINTSRLNGMIEFYGGNLNFSKGVLMGLASNSNTFYMRGNDNFMNMEFTGGIQMLAGSHGVVIGGRGGLKVTGDKNSLVFTENYGGRLLYAYESDRCYFATQGTGELKDGLCKVELDPIFLETIETDDYHILLTSKDKFIPLYATDITEKSFTVKSDTIKDGVFFYTLSAIRKGYKNKYLDEVQDESTD